MVPEMTAASELIPASGGHRDACLHVIEQPTPRVDGTDKVTGDALRRGYFPSPAPSGASLCIVPTPTPASFA